MEYRVLYEALPNSIFSTPFILGCIFAAVVIILSAICWKNNSLGAKIGSCFACAIVLLVIVSTIIGYFSTFSIWDAYKNDECQIVEGVIEDYHVRTLSSNDAYVDVFTVNGIDFIISDKPYTGYGYPLRQSDEGELGNGMYCKIYYVPFKYENVIMKILITEE